MKVLVTGKNSYAGKGIVDTDTGIGRKLDLHDISVRDDKWKSMDFSSYQAIYHVAAIVHLKEKPTMEQEYYRVNSELAYEIAKKAKNDGVKSFVFLSSIAVYGLLGDIERDIVITKDTKENPTTFNGKSKLAAEKLLKNLESENFKVPILRIPLIYGHNCPGNYASLKKLAKVTPFFPRIQNKRSMVFVDHLSDIVEFVITDEKTGTFLINNPENFNTLNLVQEIARNHNKKVHSSFLLALVIKLLGNRFSMTRKIFGTVYYDIRDTRIDGFSYDDITFAESIRQTEKRELGDSY